MNYAKKEQIHNIRFIKEIEKQNAVILTFQGRVKVTYILEKSITQLSTCIKITCLKQVKLDVFKIRSWLRCHC